MILALALMILAISFIEKILSILSQTEQNTSNYRKQEN